MSQTNKQIVCVKCSVLLGIIERERLAVTNPALKMSLNPAAPEKASVECPGCHHTQVIQLPTKTTTRRKKSSKTGMHLYPYAGAAVIWLMLGKPTHAPNERARRATRLRYAALCLAGQMATSLRLGVAHATVLASSLSELALIDINAACEALGFDDSSDEPSEIKRLDRELGAALSLCRETLRAHWTLVDEVVKELAWLEHHADDVLITEELAQDIAQKVLCRVPASVPVGTAPSVATPPQF